MPVPDLGPDLVAKSFSLNDLRQAQQEGRRQGIDDTLVLLEAGATVDYIREHLLERTDEEAE